MSSKVFRRSLFCLLILLPAFSVADTGASKGPISASLFGVAIDGKDSVAYHHPDVITAHKKAANGSKEWVHEWRGAKWRFVDKANYLAFKEEPERYRPAYGGHCANALSLGEGLIKTDGSHWQIFDNQLHLFYAARGRDRWVAGDYMDYKVDADKAWQEITGHQD